MIKEIIAKLKKPVLVVLSKVLIVQTFIILGFIYIFVLSPTAILSRISGKDFLKKKKVSKSFWTTRNKIEPTLEWAERPY